VVFMKKISILSILVCCGIMLTACGKEDGDVSGKKEEVKKGPVSISEAEKGNTVLFGKYEQDNDTANGAEDIEWIVIDKKDDKILILSKDALETLPYIEDDSVIPEGERPSWEISSIKTWLNNDFYTTAFTADEQAKISEADVGKVFLLSLEEARQYIEVDGVKIVYPTEYAKANGAGGTHKGYAWWWLRSIPDPSEEYGNGCADYLYLTKDGVLEESYTSVDAEGNCARPAMWITVK